MSSPTQRTMDKLRADGWVCQNVEKKAPRPAGMVGGRMAFHLTTTIDLFGCIDIVAIREGATMGVQATGGSENHAHRLDKIKAEPRMATWIKAGNALEIWTWRKVVAYRKDGSKAKLPKWEPRIERVTLEQLEPPAWQVALNQVRESAGVDQTLATLTRRT